MPDLQRSLVGSVATSTSFSSYYDPQGIVESRPLRPLMSWKRCFNSSREINLNLNLFWLCYLIMCLYCWLNNYNLISLINQFCGVILECFFPPDYKRFSHAITTRKSLGLRWQSCPCLFIIIPILSLKIDLNDQRTKKDHYL